MKLFYLAFSLDLIIVLVKEPTPASDVLLKELFRTCVHIYIKKMYVCRPGSVLLYKNEMTLVKYFQLKMLRTDLVCVCVGSTELA